MRFEYSSLLFLLLLLPLLGAAIGVFSYRQRNAILSKLANQKVLNEIIPNFVSYKKKLRLDIIFTTSLLFLLTFALLRPQYGFTLAENRSRKGVDIVVAMDVSKSMQAADVSPSRLHVAKRAALDLINAVKGDRLALVVFAGTAFIETPLTEDLSAFKTFLNSVSTDLIPVQGTNFELALKKSLEVLSTDDAQAQNNKAIFIITDGEDLDGNLEQAKQLIKKLGVKVYVLGVGTKEGAPVPDAPSALQQGDGGRRNNQPNAATGSFKRDPQGNIVLSRLNEDLLRRLAKETGGNYLAAIDSTDTVGMLYRKLKGALDDLKFDAATIQVWNEYYQIPLFIAVLLLILPAGFLRLTNRYKDLL